jgi:hypothetical protein
MKSEHLTEKMPVDHWWETEVGEVVRLYGVGAVKRVVSQSPQAQSE